jgi:cold shock CspA family protein
MKGTITSYLPEKQYGFIKGEDGKDYFFHENEFRDPTHIRRLCEDAWIDFDQQATPKGYRAKNCSLLDPKTVLTYTLPGEFITSRTATVRGWEVIEYADWIVHGASSDSPEAAQHDAVYHAKLVGANALIGLEYYKTTGSEPGSGRGTHHFTIHNFRGQLATLAKRTSKGPYRHDQLLGLNGRAESLKKELMVQTRASKRKRNLIWSAVLVLSIISSLVAPVLVIAWIVLGFIFGGAKNHDDWLERV